MAVHSNSTTSIEEGRIRAHVQLRMDRTDDGARPSSGIGDSVEAMKHEREVENEEAATKAETSKRSLDSLRAIGGTNEALLANEEGNKRVYCESMDENDLVASKALMVREGKEDDEMDVEKAGPTGTRAKGKEKALSDGNFDGNGNGNDNDNDDESFGSVESCNSAGLLSRGKKRLGFEQQLILGTKRVKTINQECLGSTSKLKQDSSFVNWISNMTRGIWKGNEDENSPFVALPTTSDLKENNECRNTGFQSFFQSIYCPRKRSQDAVEMDANAPSLQDETSKGDHLSSSGNEVAPKPNVGFNQTSEAKEPNISFLSLTKSKPAFSEADEKVTNRNFGLESLWISRFSSKSYLPQKTDLQERIITNDSPSDVAEIPSQKILTDKINTVRPMVSSLRIESSEAVTCLFARRLEATKHMMTNLICFYCGKKGHLLRDCVEVTDTELRDLVQNVSARNGREELSSLCIRCFQLSHWAATCPNAPPYSSGVEERAMKHALASTSSNFTVPKTVFEAVQVLRLTRAEVLKWINTKKSVSGLAGFFLRLRLGKWEEELGGTGYYVARIDEGKEGQSSSKSSVSVKVKGLSCIVESQFISNHDFLEEELKTWWGSTSKSAGKSGGGDGIPSAEELSRKIQQRKMLGF